MLILLLILDVFFSLDKSEAKTLFLILQEENMEKS